MTIKHGPLNCPCEGAYFKNVFTYDAPPEGEIRFQFSSSDVYRRELLRCQLCDHFVSVHEMDDTALYNSEYVSATYGEDGIGRAFERINSLDPASSDNVGRVRRILDYSIGRFNAAPSDRAIPSILDVGSGLCVFLHRMKEAGWNCTALDPDPRAAAHAQQSVGVRGICGDFMNIQDLGRFDVITFNKVLEHVIDPVAMLRKSADHLREGGFVYVELPDGEAAIADGPGREEFFIDHLHVFSSASFTLLAARAGFSILALERLREPSSKYTLRSFLVPSGVSDNHRFKEIQE